MVIVRPSLLKLAITGTLECTVTTAVPLPSLKLADGIALLPKVRVGEAGATTGSCEKVIRSAPGSVATVGLTGAVKLKTRRGGLSPAREAVKCVATLPMNRRPESSCKVTGPPRILGRRELREETETSPRLFSTRNL